VNDDSLEERLRSLLDDPPAPPRAGPFLVRGAERRATLQHRRRVGVTVTVFTVSALVVATLVGLASRSRSDHRVQVAVNPSPPMATVEHPPLPMGTTPQSTLTSPPTTTLATGLRPGEGLLALGVVHTLAIDASAVYAQVSQYVEPAGPDSIVRIDRRTGSQTKSAAVLNSPGPLVTTGRWLWASDSPLALQGGHHAQLVQLVQLDATTLAVRQRIDVPGEFESLAITPAGLWVGASTRVLRFDAETGRLTRSIALSTGDATAVAADPGGQRIYIAQSNVGPDPSRPDRPYQPTVVTERDAVTGALIATRTDLSGYAGATLSAIGSPQGVWVSFSTGMMGQVQLLRSSDLATIAGVHPAGGYSAGTNSISGTGTGGLLWLSDAALSRLACADQATDQVLATRSFPTLDSVPSLVLSDGSTLYAAVAAGLAMLKPDPACR